MTDYEKKTKEGEIELGAPTGPVAMGQAVSSETKLDATTVALLENIDVFYIQQKVQWKEGR